MSKYKAKILLSAFLLSAFSASVHAVTCAALDGTLLFNNKQNFGHRIYHAFDLPYAKQTGIGPTFATEKVIDPIVNYLATLASKGYTHIQISPPSLSTPSTHMLPGPIDLNKLQAQVYQGSKEGSPIAAIPIPSKSYNAWEFAYQPLLCVLDSTYQAELDAVFGKNTDGSSKKLVSQYGVTIGGKVVGYRLGCDRYGSMAALVALINSAKTHGIRIIADGVFNYTSGYNTNYSGPDVEDNYTKFHPVTYVPQNGSTPATYTWDESVDLTDFYTPFREFEDQPDHIKFAPDSWVFGPDLAVENPDVQQMIVGYMQLLSDVGLCGMRFDLLYGLGPDATRSIMTKAKSAGMFPPPYSFGYAELDQPLEDLATYGALLPAHDHPLHFSLTKCLTLKPDGWGELAQTELPSVSTLVAPKGLGNFTTATFSVNHDQYPQVSTGTDNLKGFYSESKDPENVADTILSQLSMVYLCAKRDGNPHVLRFEDERDHKKLIQRSLAFRVIMERQTAPHEYIAALGHDVLLIARQYGFVVINRGSTPHNIAGDDLQALVKANNAFSAYLPGLSNTQGMVYDELLGLGTNSQTYNSGQSYTLSETGFNTLFSVDSMDAKFLVLRNTAGQNAYDVAFTTSCSSTGLGDMVFVAGNHPLLGDWNPRADCLNGLLCTQSASDPAGLYPKWASLPLRFPAGISLEYKYLIAYAGTHKKIKTWEKGSDFSVSSKKQGKSQSHATSYTQVQPQKKLHNRIHTVVSDGIVPAEPAAIWPVTHPNSDESSDSSTLTIWQ